MHGRCEPVNDGSDRFLRTVLLWCALLPMGRRWGLDARRAPTRGAEGAASRVSGCAPLGLSLQLALMYWGTVANRARGVMWFEELSAVRTR